jgi:cytochrome c-type biogenesis protein CcmH
MHHTKRISMFLACVLFMQGALSQTHDLYPFHDAAQREHFNGILHSYQCLVCGNETLADSQVFLASDLRRKLYIMIQHHLSDGSIHRYLIDRYGAFVVYEAPFNVHKLLLWLGLILGVFGLAGMGWRLKQQGEDKAGSSHQSSA